MSRQEWTRLLKSKGLLVTRPDLLKLEELLAPLGKAQADYAIRQYGLETEYPNLGDLVDWMGRQALPDDLSCTAYLTGIPELARLGDELEALLGAWFPTQETKALIEALRSKLGRALF